jgi:hypothetical protein
MFEVKSLRPAEADPTVRTLKIEADGDFSKGLIKPKIRITGQWLERAGFSPGNRVQVTCVSPGVIELRSPDASTVNETKPSPQQRPDWPF